MVSKNNTTSRGVHTIKFKITVNIQYDGRQYSIRIPAQVVRLLKIKKGDKFTFDVDLDKENKHDKVRFRLGD